jgi:hypothetical protein
MTKLALCIAGLLVLPIFAVAGVGAAAPQQTTLGSEAELAPFDLAAGPLESQVLAHPRIHLTQAARSDVEKARIDPRVLQVLLLLAQHHELNRVGPLSSGHSYFVKGTTRVSNHIPGRAVDISVIDGIAVRARHREAYAAARLVASLPPPLRPDELGGPWRFEVAGVHSFTKGHGGHLHVGFDG